MTAKKQDNEQTPVESDVTPVATAVTPDTGLTPDTTATTTDQAQAPLAEPPDGFVQLYGDDGVASVLLIDHAGEQYCCGRGDDGAFLVPVSLVELAERHGLIRVK